MMDNREKKGEKTGYGELQEDKGLELSGRTGVSVQASANKPSFRPNSTNRSQSLF